MNIHIYFIYIFIMLNYSCICCLFLLPQNYIFYIIFVVYFQQFCYLLLFNTFLFHRILLISIIIIAIIVIIYLIIENGNAIEFYLQRKLKNRWRLFDLLLFYFCC